MADSVENFSDLGAGEQYRMIMSLLRRTYTGEAKGLALSQRPEVDFSPTKQLEINPRPIKLRIYRGGEGRSVKMNEACKLMFAYFVLLTEAKIERGINPLITSQELADYSPEFTRNQMLSHLLGPLEDKVDSAGVLEKISYRGYRLNCLPREARKALKGYKDYPLDVIPFDTWFPIVYPGRIVIDSGLIHMVKALYDLHREETSRENNINRQALGETIDRNLDTVFEQLRRLRELGVISGVSGQRYQVVDINWDYVDEVVEGQKEPIKIEVTLTKELTSPVLEDLEVEIPRVREEGVVRVSPMAEPLVPKVPEYDENLAREIKPHLIGQIRMATSRDSLYLNPLPPTASFAYHTSLSGDKSGRIPWNELEGSGLALPGEKDHHPLLSPAGALVAVLYLNPNVRTRLRGGKSKSLETLGVNIAHLLTAFWPRNIDEKTERYVRACLRNLDEASPSLLCNCEACRKVKDDIIV